MAQRKSAPANRPGSARSGPAANRPGGKPGSATASTRTGGGAANKGPKKKPKSIVNQRQTPWGLIVTTVAIVLFAAAIVVVVVATHKSGSDVAAVSAGGQSVDTTGKDTYRAAALPAAMAIKGVSYTVEGEHDHVNGTVKYDASPPIGGKHAPLWADCTGTVYTHQLANENAVHALEHGAVWVTYNPSKVSKADIAVLAKDVGGVDRALLTPYAGLKTAVSLQAWGYQLFVSSATDPRVEKFITTLSGNTATWPEPGASCTDPSWDASKSHPGHPLDD